MVEQSNGEIWTPTTVAKVPPPRESKMPFSPAAIAPGGIFEMGHVAHCLLYSFRNAAQRGALGAHPPNQNFMTSAARPPTRSSTNTIGTYTKIARPQRATPKPQKDEQICKPPPPNNPVGACPSPGRVRMAWRGQGKERWFQQLGALFSAAPEIVPNGSGGADTWFQPPPGTLPGYVGREANLGFQLVGGDTGDLILGR